MPSQLIAPSSLEIQARDLDILRTLLDARVAYGRQIAALHFSGKREATKKRLQALKRSGFIAARRRRPQEPAVHFVTRAAVRLLKDRGLLSDCSPTLLASLERTPRAPGSTVRCQLEVLDIRIALATALASLPGITLARFTASPQVPAVRGASQRNGNAVRIRPDAFFEIDEGSPGGQGPRHRLFLQLERPAESLDVLTRRADAYRTHFQSGDFARFLGEAHQWQLNFPFRVLYVFKSAERRDAFARLLLSKTPRILTQAWLTTLPELVTDPFGPIWVCPADYRPLAANQPQHRTSLERRRIVP